MHALAYIHICVSVGSAFVSNQSRPSDFHIACVYACGFVLPFDMSHWQLVHHNRAAALASVPRREGNRGPSLLFACTGKYCTTQAGDVQGDDIEETSGQTAASCAERCASNAACGCYAFDPSRDSTCWLKQSPCGGSSDWHEAGDMTSGICTGTTILRRCMRLCGFCLRFEPTPRCLLYRMSPPLVPRECFGTACVSMRRAAHACAANA